MILENTRQQAQAGYGNTMNALGCTVLLDTSLFPYQLARLTDFAFQIALISTLFFPSLVPKP